MPKIYGQQKLILHIGVLLPWKYRYVAKFIIRCQPGPFPHQVYLQNQNNQSMEPAASNLIHGSDLIPDRTPLNRDLNPQRW